MMKILLIFGLSIFGICILAYALMYIIVEIIVCDSSNNFDHSYKKTKKERKKMRIINKIVDYYKYCRKCKYSNKDENDEPCDTCLSNPTNVNSQKPIKFEEKD